MAEDISKVRIGVVRVKYKGVVIGHTLDGVDFVVEREFEDLNVDKYGGMPVDKALVGQRVLITMKLAQPDFETLDAAIPEGLTQDQSGDTTDRVGLGTDAGYLLREGAGELHLRPRKNIASENESLNADDESEDITIYKAASVRNITLPYKVREQRVVEVTFEGFVDESYESNRRLGHIGPGTIS